MKGKRIILMAMTLMLTMSVCTSAYAQSLEVYTPNQVYYESTAPQPPAKVARAIWMTYEKSIILEKYTESADPHMSEFPQTVFYREPNPAGYGEQAAGTLTLVAVGKMRPDNPNHHGYYCSYRGTMGYFLQ